MKLEMRVGDTLGRKKCDNLSAASTGKIEMEKIDVKKDCSCMVYLSTDAAVCPNEVAAAGE